MNETTKATPDLLYGCFIIVGHVFFLIALIGVIRAGIENRFQVHISLSFTCCTVFSPNKVIASSMTICLSHSTSFLTRCPIFPKATTKVFFCVSNTFILVFIVHIFSALDISYTREHMALVFQSLTSFRIVFSSLSLVVSKAKMLFFQISFRIVSSVCELRSFVFVFSHTCLRVILLCFFGIGKKGIWRKAETQRKMNEYKCQWRGDI